MEGKETIPNANTTPPPPMMGGGVPAPMMAGGGYSPMMTPQPPAPVMAEGGDTGGAGKKNPFKDFFSDINLVEAGILALGVAAFLYAIHYYKFEMKMTKTGYADLNGRVQKLESAETSRQAKEASANANGMARRSRRRMLI